ncbi:MAG: alpha/beta fold hydrolase [Rhodoferax sp.]|nr:alpha/beta fold hydrolase [Rhodoferax sp.]
MNSNQSSTSSTLNTQMPTTLDQALAVQDPFGMVSSVLTAQAAWLKHPSELLQALNTTFIDALAFQSHLLRLSLGLPSEDVIKPHVDDVRFADPDWVNNPVWDVAKEFYLAFTHRTEDMLFDTPGLSETQRKRAAFWARQWLNAMAPTNFFFSNPIAMRRFFETNGDSLRKGFMNFVRDAKAKNIRMVEADAFKVGVDLATTPGRVVMRNRLVELIHYTPTTAQVHQTPIVIITPWINKYYVLDLTPQKSMVKFLTDQGYSVFITSWKNPTAEMAGLSFDDYLLEGVDPAVQAARQICKAPQVHLTGYCIGGTLVTSYMAWAARHFDAKNQPVAHWTLLTTLTNFAKPGDIDVFIDEPMIQAIEKKMAKTGFLDGNDMATSFRLLRSNSLVWHYFEHSYLLGEPLPAFDVLFWNMDTTRMPATMHSYYLRQMYLHNNLVKPDAMTLGGEKIDLTRIAQPLYAVSAEDDHIVPWRQSYLIRQHLNAKTPVRFVLSTSGHIFGIVNPVVNPPKRNFWVGEPKRQETSEDWYGGATKTTGSWWTDWMAWLAPKCGPMVSAPKLAVKSYPDLGAAPGTYVFEQ